MRVRTSGVTTKTLVCRNLANTATLYSVTNSVVRDYCEDELGKSSVHPLTIFHVTPYAQPTDWTGISYRMIGQEVGWNVWPSAVPGYAAIFDAWNSTIGTSRILAQSGPATPKVNIGTFLAELRDLPRMLKDAGDLLLGIRNRLKWPKHYKPVFTPRGAALQAASQTLAYQFGWGPLLQDLSRMLGFADLVHQRQKELYKLYMGESIRKKIYLGPISVGYSGSQAIFTLGGINISPQYKTSHVGKGWATVRWSLRDRDLIGKVPPPTELWWEALKSVYGLHGGSIPTQIWKALPWSWMIDWFSDVSSHLIATNNMILYKPDRVCVMATIDHHLDWTPYQESASRKFGGAGRGVVTKHRDIRNVGPFLTTSLRIPFLDPFKLSVLGSFTVLGILQGRKGVSRFRRPIS